jgi:hypothetical protein
MPKWFKWFRVAASIAGGIAFFLCWRFLGRIVLAWRSPNGATPDIGAIILGLFGLFVMTWVGTWRVASQRQMRTFSWIFPLTNLLPSALGFCTGYFCV